MNANHTVRNIIIAFIALFLLAGAFSGGLLVGWLIPERTPLEVPIQVNPTANDSELLGIGDTPENLAELFKPFWETWQLTHDQFVDQPVDNTLMMQGAIRGMLDSLGDKHTGYMDPEEFQQASIPLDGSYEGIGAWVETAGKYLTITSPMPGSPAEKAGLKPGDEVTSVDGNDVADVDPSIVLKSVLGPAGTDVTLTIYRPETEETFDVTITRSRIEMPSLESKMLDENIGYIILSTFGETTGYDLQKALQEILAKDPKGLILDLRYNGGGYLDTAVEVISQFIPDGTVLIEEMGDGEQNLYKALPGGVAIDIPLIVLVNEGSASASEITAGAIQDYGRGIIVGTTTYGKGSVQNWIPLQNNQGAIRVTIARWLTPNGRQINEIGLTPDYIIELTQADIDAELDPQLQKAIDLLVPGD